MELHYRGENLLKRKKKRGALSRKKREKTRTLSAGGGRTILFRGWGGGTAFRGGGEGGKRGQRLRRRKNHCHRRGGRRYPFLLRLGRPFNSRKKSKALGSRGKNPSLRELIREGGGDPFLIPTRKEFPSDRRWTDSSLKEK